MISPDIRKTIMECAREFDVKAVWIFGSSLEDDSVARDIDLAVEGISPELFFKFYARLFMALPKPVDLVDLSQEEEVRTVSIQNGLNRSQTRALETLKTASAKVFQRVPANGQISSESAAEPESKDFSQMVLRDLSGREIEGLAEKAKKKKACQNSIDPASVLPRKTKFYQNASERRG